MTTPLRSSALPLHMLRHGKVRDVYEVDDDRLLLVATDRVSAFDVVLDQPVPNKGAVLTQLTAWWLGQIHDVPHHMITASVAEIIAMVPSLREYGGVLAGRAMLSWRANVFPVECVVREYLSGSGWKDYSATGKLGGEAMAAGLVESAKLPEPRFTPATKAESGHDQNISRAEMREQLGPVASTLEALSLRLFSFGSAVASRAGLILADTKFEFGERNGEVMLIDEVMTPDSSRYWSRDSYRAGTTPPSFDKQPLRDYLQRLRLDGKWNGEAPGPEVPPEVIEAMTERYLEAYHRLTGGPLSVEDRA